MSKLKLDSRILQGKRVSAIVGLTTLDRAKFERATGFSRSTLDALIEKEHRITPKTLNKLKEAALKAGVLFDKDWLLTGKGFNPINTLISKGF